MSKERLEEIVAVVESQKESVRKLSHNDLNWLIEQAERVRELEKARKTLSDNHFQQIEQHKYLLQQNKRYREAIEEVLSIENYGVATDYIKVITNILLDALEESK